jgi:AcrR family transcriptional regulator
MGLVADVLEAAVRVLAREGAARFTMARVAETAGVSVGSLYQYFPNKQAILFRLQTDEWTETKGLLEGILTDSQVPPLERLRTAVRMFFRSECEEAELRVALADAAPLYRDAPETKAHRKSSSRLALALMEEALPGRPAKERAFAGDVIMTSMGAIGKKISEQGRPRSEVDALADAVGDMFCAYLERLG